MNKIVGAIGLLLSILLLIITVILTVNKKGSKEINIVGYIASTGFMTVSLMLIFY